MKNTNKKAVSITAIKLHDTVRDNYIFNKYSSLSQKSELVKNAISVGFKIEETMPFLHKLILLAIEQNKELTANDIEAVFLIDKKYSLMIDENNLKNTSNKDQIEPYLSNNQSDLNVEEPLLCSDLSTLKNTIVIPDILRNISK